MILEYLIIKKVVDVIKENQPKPFSDEELKEMGIDVIEINRIKLNDLNGKDL